MVRRGGFAVWLAGFIGFACVAGVARADGGGDGVYRRWDHDAILTVGAGGGFAALDSGTHGTTALALRLRFADAAGPVVAFRYGPAVGGQLFVGVEVRPLWPALFLIGAASMSEWLDLFVQSFSVELGVAVLPLGNPDPGEVDSAGFGFGAGLGIELPLQLPSRTRGHFHGLALRLAARRVWARPRFQGAPEEVDLSEWAGLATLVVRIGVGIGSSSWEPARYRPRRSR